MPIERQGGLSLAHAHRDGRLPLTQFVVLDDLDLVQPQGDSAVHCGWLIRSKFVKTEPSIGLTVKDVERAKVILNAEAQFNGLPEDMGGDKTAQTLDAKEWLALVAHQLQLCAPATQVVVDSSMKLPSFAKSTQPQTKNIHRGGATGARIHTLHSSATSPSPSSTSSLSTSPPPDLLNMMNLLRELARAKVEKQVDKTEASEDKPAATSDKEPKPQTDASERKSEGLSKRELMARAALLRANPKTVDKT